jgi:predicted nucleic acid-binding protein
MGRGIGWVDVHLLASAKLSGSPLWTQNRRLAVIAWEQGLVVG